MRVRFPFLTFFVCAAMALVSSCSTESVQQLQEKEDQKTQAYENHEEKLEIREQARDQRYNAWFNRVMN